MEILIEARALYEAGRFHDALEAAQSACERRPQDGDAWWLLAQISRHRGLPQASDDAFRRSAALSRRHHVPVRMSTERMTEVVTQATSRLSPDARRRLAATRVDVQPLPDETAVRGGVRPDALSNRVRQPQDVLTLFQVNVENRSKTEAELAAQVERILARA